MGIIKKLKKAELYDSIETMPIYNWFKINETNDLRWVLKDFNAQIGINAKALLNAWNKIFDEFIEVFGIPDKLREIMEMKRDIMILESQVALKGDRTRLPFIEIKRDALEKLLKSEKKGVINQAKIYVEKFMGFRLNEKETSVKEFYGYVNALNEHTKRNGRQNS